MPTIDPYSVVPLPLTLVANGQAIGQATGFFYKLDGGTYLVSNWHVLSGRDPQYGQPMHKSGAVPDSITLALHLTNALGQYRPDSTISLTDVTGNPIWFQHPDRGQDVDVAALKIDRLPEDVAVYEAVRPDEKTNMAFAVGMDVFVLGYPLGLTHQGILPVWKRASIATEPELPVAGLPVFLVDTATREGMSGSPVIARSYGQVMLAHGGGTSMGGGIYTRFLGIYSGRYGADDEFAAQLGRVWHRSVIDEVIRGQARGAYILR